MDAKVSTHTFLTMIIEESYVVHTEYNFFFFSSIKVITKLPNSDQSYKGKVKTHNYINRQNQSTTGKLNIAHE